MMSSGDANFPGTSFSVTDVPPEYTVGVMPDGQQFFVLLFMTSFTKLTIQTSDYQKSDLIKSASTGVSIVVAVLLFIL